MWWSLITISNVSSMDFNPHQILGSIKLSTGFLNSKIPSSSSPELVLSCTRPSSVLNWFSCTHSLVLHVKVLKISSVCINWSPCPWDVKELKPPSMHPEPLMHFSFDDTNVPYALFTSLLCTFSCAVVITQYISVVEVKQLVFNIPQSLSNSSLKFFILCSMHSFLFHSMNLNDYF